MAMIEVSIVPVGTKTASLSRYVARAVDLLNKEGLKYELTAMGTIIEGDLGKILDAARKIHEAAFVEGVPRVVTIIRIDERRDKPSSIESKMESVKRKLVH
jgi:uncharacterized protein (TIGR00106 family)